jgi:hypothetical protein
MLSKHMKRKASRWGPPWTEARDMGDGTVLLIMCDFHFSGYNKCGPDEPPTSMYLHSLPFSASVGLE